MAIATWDEKRFIAVLRAKYGDDAAAVAQRLVDWAIGRGLEITWGKGDHTGYFGPKLRIGDELHTTFRCWTNGKVDSPGFLSDKIRAIPGVTIFNESAKSHPSVEMATLAEADRLSRFLAVWDGYLDEKRKGNR
ncbi:MAG: hypothetical protein KF893_20770 [Caldilineaceae bacterium]|nr:hypothetical protein [Caldilineaceae bacterium]